MFIRECFHCRQDVRKAYRCSKCKITYYCSRDCQLLHWAAHKHDCKRIGPVSDQALAQQRELVRLMKRYSLMLADAYHHSDPNTHVVFIQEDGQGGHRIYTDDPKREAHLLGIDLVEEAIRTETSGTYQIVCYTNEHAVLAMSKHFPRNTKGQIDALVAAMDRRLGLECSTSGRD